MEKLEDTIRQVQQKYKNRPSPLSETYIRTNSNIHIIPYQVNKSNDIRSNLLGTFKPQNDTFR